MMKALLKLGDFTHVIDIADREREITIIAPLPRGVIHMEGGVVSDIPALKRWKFGYTKQLDYDLYQYDWEGEV